MFLITRAFDSSPTHFFYHSFTARDLPHITPLYPCKRPEDLERDIRYLTSTFRFVSHDEVVAHREKGSPLPPKAVALSFDDGFAECFTVVRPLLLAHGIPAIFFVCTGFIDNRDLMFRNKIALCLSRITESRKASELSAALQERFELPVGSPDAVRAWLGSLQFADRAAIEAVCECLGTDVPTFLRECKPYMDSDQIAKLHADGFTIGAHSIDHPRLGELTDWDEVKRQIRESCDVVRRITGRARVPFSFPFNAFGVSQDALAILRDRFGGIDLMYDSNNVMKSRAFIINRICADEPRGATSKHSNLPALLWQARLLRPIRAARSRMLRGQGPSKMLESEV
jgi:peptidoglycan/xylan/chitin deacetylase (PgdA/CDA1 family)